MMISAFIKKLKETPTTIDFKEMMDMVDAHYNYTPVGFTNGNIINEPEQNAGSCKLFSFAKLQNLTKEETLYCFGKYYKDVLENPEGADHQNIRNFMKTGWQGLSFSGTALIKK